MAGIQIKVYLVEAPAPTPAPEATAGEPAAGECRQVVGVKLSQGSANRLADQHPGAVVTRMLADKA
ncbi:MULTISPECIES: hypothetical protein [Azospirillaceae]|uniref:hypothetical protein n=1 Tax=Azospirillaceae TaxID=2829815 RepID=UPI000B63239C|nr:MULTISPECIES: hypothetical protein [Azospirillaceae]MDG5496972.1 hypothetical protein [Niveispirillum sp. BGYR6]SNS83810.1 hypothetical protein SAMN05880556_11327 [Azospirillum sp. RU38E]SNT01036.1 hypothetical protein SAMN05880591_11326 [Azospirillum sp. RU37A]